jgi:hypothetical protein
MEKLDQRQPWGRAQEAASAGGAESRGGTSTEMVCIVGAPAELCFDTFDFVSPRLLERRQCKHYSFVLRFISLQISIFFS